METQIIEIKDQVLKALAHPEAEDGLYLNNLMVVHEAEERDQVVGTQLEVLDALKDLIKEGKVIMNETAGEVIFKLVGAY